MRIQQRLESLPTARLRLLAGLTTAISILILAIYWWRLDVSSQALRQDALDQVTLRSNELAGAVAAQTEATLRTVDFALRHLRDEYVNGHDLESDIRTIYESFPANSINQIGFVNADGYLVWSSVGVNGRIYLGDREHIKVHLNSRDDQLFISNPVLGRASGAWSIQFSRPVRNKGKLLGVLVLSLSPQYLAEGHRDMALRETDVISLFRQDGAYLSRTPNLMEALGKSVASDRPFLQANAPAQGVFRTEASFDKIDRTYAWRRLQNYPIIVNIGITESAALAAVQQEIDRNWRHTRIGSGLILLLSLGISLLLLRAAKQQQALVNSESRHRAFFQRNTSVKLLIDPASGQIMDANPAAINYYGYGPALVGMKITDINCLPPEEVRAEMERAKSEQRIYFNFRHRLASGSERHVEVYSGPVEVDGKPLLFSIIHDVTPRHELEQRLIASEEHHRKLIQAMAEGVILIDGQGAISAWNSAALDILGVDGDSLQAHKIIARDSTGELLPIKDHPSVRTLRGEYLDHVPFCVEKSDGSQTWINVTSRPLSPDGKPDDGAVVSFSDISKLVEAEASLRLSKSVFDAAGEGILVTDADNKIITVNPAFTQITGYKAEEVIGGTPSLLASGLQDKSFYINMWQRLTKDGHWEGEISNRRKDGRVYIEWLRISVIPEQNGHGRRYVAIFSDITDRKREAQLIWHQANFDELTNLPNRKLLEDRLQRALAQAHRKRTTVAVLFIDLDRFKPVNDQYGHAAGDELLQQVARRLEHCLRDEDTVARIGGDEFVVVLPDLRMADLPVKVAEKIVAVLSEPFRIGEHFVEISCSIGISLFPRDADNAEKLLSSADAAMYGAKDAGRGTWQSRSPS